MVKQGSLAYYDRLSKKRFPGNVMKKKKRTVSAATKERLRKMREKHKLGEYAPKGSHFKKKRSNVKSRVSTKSRKVRKRTTNSMAKKKYSRKRSSGLSLKGIVGQPLVKKAALGLGGAALVSMVASKVNIPGVSTNTASIAGAFLFGGLPGAAAALLIPGLISSNGVSTNGVKVI